MTARFFVGFFNVEVYSRNRLERKNAVAVCVDSFKFNEMIHTHALKVFQRGNLIFNFLYFDSKNTK